MTEYPLAGAVTALNQKVLDASKLSPTRVERLRNPKYEPQLAHSMEELTENWTVAAKEGFDYWFGRALAIVRRLDREELIALDPFQGVLIFGLRFSASENETVLLAVVRIVCAIIGELDPERRHLFKPDDWLEQFLRGYIIPPTPMLMNMGNERSFTKSSISCFLASGPNEYGTEYTLDILSLIAKTAANGGAIGMNISSCAGGTGPGASLPTAALYSSILENYPQARYRKATGTLYMETWHVDVIEFIELHMPRSKWLRRTDRVFPAIWVNDLFMRRLAANEPWHLFNPERDPRIKGLVHVWGAEFDALYSQLEEEALYDATVCPREIISKLAHATIAAGAPFVLFKDTVNGTSCHTDVYGTITSSNLCTEIVQYRAPGEMATCNLMSINVERILRGSWNDGRLDYTLLRGPMHAAVQLATIRCFTPPNGVATHSVQSRAIGVGVQGYSDLLRGIKVPYLDSGEILRRIFEHMYYYALEMSVKMVEVYGRFEGFDRSYYAKGKLHFDYFDHGALSTSLDWDGMRIQITKRGLANSLFLAQMPTSHSAAMWNSSEWFEPPSRAVERKKGLSGDCISVIKGLSGGELEYELGALLTRTKSSRFESGWDMPIMSVLAVWKEVVPFIDQSASLSWYLNGGESEVVRGLIYCWRNRFKTALYYMRVRPHGSNKIFLNCADDCSECHL